MLRTYHNSDDENIVHWQQLLFFFQFVSTLYTNNDLFAVVLCEFAKKENEWIAIINT